MVYMILLPHNEIVPSALNDLRLDVRNNDAQPLNGGHFAVKLLVLADQYELRSSETLPLIVR